MKDETNGNQTVLCLVSAQANHGEWRTDVRRDGAHREKKFKCRHWLLSVELKQWLEATSNNQYKIIS